MSDTTTITIRVDRSTKERLETVAASFKRTKSYIAAEALEAYLEIHEWQIAGIEQALASLDSGKAIEHDSVTAWVNSWDSDDEMPTPSA